MIHRESSFLSVRRVRVSEVGGKREEVRRVVAPEEKKFVSKRGS